MDPVTGVFSFYGRAFDFFGRARRSEYVWAILLHIFIYGIGFFMISNHPDLERLLGGELAPDSGELSPVVRNVLYGMGFYWFVSFIPWTSLAFRRFHDMGHTGFYTALFIVLTLIPIIGGIAFIAQQLWLIFGGGYVGTNQYGSDPRFAVDRTFA